MKALLPLKCLRKAPACIIEQTIANPDTDFSSFLHKILSTRPENCHTPPLPNQQVTLETTFRMSSEDSQSSSEGCALEKQQGSQDKTTLTPTDQAASSSALDAKSASSGSTTPESKAHDTDEREADNKEKEEEEAGRSDEMMMLHWLAFGS